MPRGGSPTLPCNRRVSAAAAPIVTSSDSTGYDPLPVGYDPFRPLANNRQYPVPHRDRSRRMTMATKWLFVAPVAGALGIGAGIGVRPTPHGRCSRRKPSRTSSPRSRCRSPASCCSTAGSATSRARGEVDGRRPGRSDLPRDRTSTTCSRAWSWRTSTAAASPPSATTAASRSRAPSSSFAINLNGNPTFAGIVSQMRGERVEVVLTPGAANQPGKLIGRHRRRREAEGARGQRATVDVEVLNMWCAEGLRRSSCPTCSSCRFANPRDRERVPPGARRAGAVATTARRRR